MAEFKLLFPIRLIDELKSRFPALKGELRNLKNRILKKGEDFYLEFFLENPETLFTSLKVGGDALKMTVDLKDFEIQVHFEKKVPNLWENIHQSRKEEKEYKFDLSEFYRSKMVSFEKEKYNDLHPFLKSKNLLELCFNFLQEKDISSCNLVCRFWREIAEFSFRKKSMIKLKEDSEIPFKRDGQLYLQGKTLEDVNNLQSFFNWRFIFLCIRKQEDKEEEKSVIHSISPILNSWNFLKSICFKKTDSSFSSISMSHSSEEDQNERNVSKQQKQNFLREICVQFRMSILGTYADRHKVLFENWIPHFRVFRSQFKISSLNAFFFVFGNEIFLLKSENQPADQKIGDTVKWKNVLLCKIPQTNQKEVKESGNFQDIEISFDFTPFLHKMLLVYIRNGLLQGIILEQFLELMISSQEISKNDSVLLIVEIEQIRETSTSFEVKFEYRFQENFSPSKTNSALLRIDENFHFESTRIENISGPPSNIDLL